MTVSNSGQQIQMQTQMKTQMHKMDGTGGGQGKGGANGMKDIMQTLEPSDRVVLQEQLSSLSDEDRKGAIDSLKSVDATNLDSNEYLQALLNSMQTFEDDALDEGPIEVYA
jgi:hypothetical protein